MPFAAELHNNILIFRSDALSAGKAKLRQVLAVEVTFENQACDLSSSHDYLLAQGRSAHDYRANGTLRQRARTGAIAEKTNCSTRMAILFCAFLADVGKRLDFVLDAIEETRWQSTPIGGSRAQLLSDAVRMIGDNETSNARRTVRYRALIERTVAENSGLMLA
ncbi:hypothetical protein [Bradyrhizobium ivorense]|uniref:hypothetical protein n=1 Tax=Bradyrhizobium ivorense TaxID=2511166 RepID=UPI001FCEE8CC|nr:hypothetical protein [Bradyrhizobium ivorense]